jgi:predicted RNA-binding protein YlxR (DUF448 family)
MLRIVRRPDGTVVLDARADASGRGAYLCPDPGCWTLALKRSSLQRALRTTLPTELRTRLEHGDMAAFGPMAERGAPASSTGGTHGS